MLKNNKKITELQESLSKCRVEGSILFLPPITNGPLVNYNEVRSALLNAGAKYKRNTFVFPNDAKPYIDRLMVGDKVNIKKEFQFFGTPYSLADRLVSIARINRFHKILEPSAGQGAIVEAIIRETESMHIDCCELMDINQSILAKHPNVNLVGEDFLKLLQEYNNHYDRIIANPPFSKNQDIDHIKKMYECLKEGGRLVSISSKSWKTGSQKKQIAFRDWLDDVCADIQEIENGSFKESGTMVGGFIVTIDK